MSRRVRNASLFVVSSLSLLLVAAGLRQTPVNSASVKPTATVAPDALVQDHEHVASAVHGATRLTSAADRAYRAKVDVVDLATKQAAGHTTTKRRPVTTTASTTTATASAQHSTSTASSQSVSTASAASSSAASSSSQQSSQARSTQQATSTWSTGIVIAGNHFGLASFSGTGHVPANSLVYAWTALANHYLVEYAGTAHASLMQVGIGSAITVNGHTYHIRRIMYNMTNDTASLNTLQATKATLGGISLQTCAHQPMVPS